MIASNWKLGAGDEAREEARDVFPLRELIVLRRPLNILVKGSPMEL
jgi:hypothetical protein